MGCTRAQFPVGLPSLTGLSHLFSLRVPDNASKQLAPQIQISWHPAAYHQCFLIGLLYEDAEPLILSTESRLALQVRQGFPLTQAQLAIAGPTHHLQKPTWATLWHRFSRRPASHLSKLIALDPFHMGCVCMTVGQKFILSRTDSYSHYEFAFPIHSSPSSTTIQEFTKRSPIDVVSHTILLKSSGPMLTAKKLHMTIRITGLITYLRQPNEMTH